MSCSGTRSLDTRMSPCRRRGEIPKFFLYRSRSSGLISDANTHSCPRDESARWKPPSPANRSMNRRAATPSRLGRQPSRIDWVHCYGYPHQGVRRRLALVILTPKPCTYKEPSLNNVALLLAHHVSHLP